VPARASSRHRPTVRLDGRPTPALDSPRPGRSPTCCIAPRWLVGHSSRSRTALGRDAIARALALYPVHATHRPPPARPTSRSLGDRHALLAGPRPRHRPRSVAHSGRLRRRRRRVPLEARGSAPRPTGARGRVITRSSKHVLRRFAPECRAASRSSCGLNLEIDWLQLPIGVVVARARRAGDVHRRVVAVHQDGLVVQMPLVELAGGRSATRRRGPRRHRATIDPRCSARARRPRPADRTAWATRCTCSRSSSVDHAAPLRCRRKIIRESLPLGCASPPTPHSQCGLGNGMVYLPVSGVVIYLLSMISARPEHTFTFACVVSATRPIVRRVHHRERSGPECLRDR